MALLADFATPAKLVEILAVTLPVVQWQVFEV